LVLQVLGYEHKPLKGIGYRDRGKRYVRDINTLTFQKCHKILIHCDHGVLIATVNCHGSLDISWQVLRLRETTLGIERIGPASEQDVFADLEIYFIAVSLVLFHELVY
jgi:hypothetical protein